MTLYKRGRKYSISIWVDGVRHLKSTGTTNRREAEMIEREFREELNRRRHQISETSPDMTFADLAARFLADGSPRPYHLDRLKVLLPHFGECPIGRISKPLVRDYRNERHAEKRLSETTLNRDVEVLRHLLYWAVDEGFLTTNPLARIRLVRARRKPRPVMSVEEESKLIASAAPHLFNTRLMEAGVVQDVRKALMGHSSGEEVNSLYTHVELPVKREAIRKLEAWVEAKNKKQQLEPGGAQHEIEPVDGRGRDRGDPERLSEAGDLGGDKAHRDHPVSR